MLSGSKYQHIANVIVLIIGFAFIEMVDFLVVRSTLSSIHDQIVTEVVKNRDGNNEELKLLRENHDLLQKIAKGQHPVADGAQ